jgi:hypothetical protein
MNNIRENTENIKDDAIGFGSLSKITDILKKLVN